MAVLSRIAFCATLSSVTGLPVSLPFADNSVDLMLDGQHISFYLDTGTQPCFAIYGPEYERRYGPESCSTLGACYFCTASNPCDDIFERQNVTITFGDGDVYTYVVHKVTLSIGKIVLDNFSIGLAIDYHNIDHQNMSYVIGILGLAYGSSEFPPSFLDQLRYRGVINDLAYSIRTDGAASDFTGHITFEDTYPAEGNVIRLSREPRSFRDLVAVPLWPVRLIDTQNALLNRRYMVYDARMVKDGPCPGYVDIGSNDIIIPESDFESFKRVSKEILRFSDTLGT